MSDLEDKNFLHKIYRGILFIFFLRIGIDEMRHIVAWLTQTRTLNFSFPERVSETLAHRLMLAAKDAASLSCVRPILFQQVTIMVFVVDKYGFISTSRKYGKHLVIKYVIHTLKGHSIMFGRILTIYSDSSSYLITHSSIIIDNMRFKPIMIPILPLVETNVLIPGNLNKYGRYVYV